MQISKSFLVVCAAAYCVALLPLRAADADTDLKLREALEKKLDDLQTQPPAAAPQLKKNAAPAPAPAPAAAPAAQPPPAPAVSAPAPADSESATKAREALRRKMDEMQTQPAVVAPQPPAGRPTPPAQWTPPPTARPSRQVAKPAPAPAPPPARAPAPAPAVQSTAKPVLTAPPPVDSDTIAKAREALRQKMAEMETQSPPASATPAQPARAVQPMPAPVPPAPPPAPAPAPAVQAPPAIVQPVPAPAPAVQAAPKAVLAVPPPVDSDTIAKAREALRQKMAEMETQSVPASTVPAQPARAVQPMPAPVPPAPAPAVQAPPAVALPAPAPAPAVQAAPKATLAAPPSVDSETIAKARKAMEQKMKELETQPPAETAAAAPTAAKPTAAKPTAQPPSRKPSNLKGAPAFPPMQGPPPSISADKQQRLAELLRKYRAEQITPEEYHQQRAKILAEP